MINYSDIIMLIRKANNQTSDHVDNVCVCVCVCPLRIRCGFCRKVVYNIIITLNAARPMFVHVRSSVPSRCTVKNEIPPHPSTPERKLNNNNGEERASIEILGEAKTLRGPPESNDDCLPCR